MAKVASGEIDTIFETAEGVAATNPAEHLKSLGAEISLGSGLESSKVEVSEAAALPEKMFYFNDFPRQVYCTLSGIRLRLIQTGEGRGVAYLTFTPDLRKQKKRCSVGTRLDLRYQSVRHPERLHPQHPARLMESSLRQTARRAQGRFQLGPRGDQSRDQRAARQPQLAVSAKGPQLRLSAGARSAYRAEPNPPPVGVLMMMASPSSSTV
jgi:hypothetical protein